jgi:phosphoribosylanthranilate isomerase
MRKKGKRMKIKICGIFREEDVAYVNEARPDFAGFVFAESRRRVSPQTAARLSRRLSGGIERVGVFVNAPLEDILALYRDRVISIAQLHGSEDWEYIGRLKRESAEGGNPAVQVIKTVVFSQKAAGLGNAQGIGAEFSAQSAENWSGKPGFCGFFEKAAKMRPDPDFFLIDSGAGGGKTFDWRVLDPPFALPRPYFLAGGINLGNIERAMHARPFAVDISSGAETEGIKDRKKIIQLTDAVRGKSG